MQEQLATRPDGAQRARRQLLVRGGTVAALVVALLAVLVILDKPSSPEPEPPVVARTVTPSSPVSPQVDASAPSLADSAKDMVAQSADAPSVENASLVPSPPAAASVPQGVPEETMDPTAPVLGVPAKVPPTAVVREPVTKPAGVPVTPRLTVGAEPVKPVVTKQEAKVPPAIKDGYVVQLGVFSDYDNAEQLYKRLQAAGVSARLETRVQVGPFKSRNEAVAAQAQLKKLGLESGMVVAGHPR